MNVIRPGFRMGKAAGVLSIVIASLIASYYSVIGGWSMEFLFKSFSGSFVKMAPDSVSSIFGNFISEPWAPIGTHLLFLGLCALIVVMGVKSGIEKFSKSSIPILFVLIVGMAVYSIFLPGAGEGVKYLLKPDFSQISPRSFVYALGQSFYSLSLGMGIVVTYGSYIRKDEDIVATSAGTAVSDHEENSEVLWLDIEEALQRDDVPDLTKKLIEAAINGNPALTRTDYFSREQHGTYSLYAK